MLSDFDLEGRNKFQKAAYYLKNYGTAYTVKKVLRKVGLPISEESEYMTWCRRMTPAKDELKQQKASMLAEQVFFTVITEQGDDVDMADWKRQSCNNITFFELKKGATLADLLAEVRGEYLVFVHNRIKVAPNFLYEVSKAVKEPGERGKSRIRPFRQEQADIVYTDEDNCVGRKRCRPFFKPDASMQLLLNFPYLGRCFVMRRSLLVKLFEAEVRVNLTGNGWYDLMLQGFRYARHICHIPQVLFSNQVRADERNSFVHHVDDRLPDCLEHYLRKENIGGRVVQSDVPGFYHIEYALAEEPLVSIIIPNKDHVDDLKLCLDSLREKSDYRNFEVIIAENNSEEAETFAYYEKLKQEDSRIHVVTWEGSFNYSAINNFAVKSAKGALLLFLNNDTEFRDKQTLRELVISTLKPGVGASGAMLYYGDDTIQHGGVIIGMGGFAAHALWSLTDRDEKYYPFSLCEREVSAVTGACLMVRREVYDEVGGMGEDFVVALNDVDFCLKIRAAGHAIIFNPYARLYHYESKSRGYEDTAEKQARFQSEITRLQTKWEAEITEGDPYYNPNLTLHRADYSMDI